MTSNAILALLVLLCVPGLAQQDASSRLHSTTRAPREITFSMAAGRLRPEKGPSPFCGSGPPEVVYDNTCVLATIFFAGMSPTDVFLDNGQVPSSSNFELFGCADALEMAAFSFGYCSDQASVDVRLGFHELHDNCTDIATASGSSATYTFTGLPGSTTAGALCWIVTVDLTGTTVEWPFLADGDGVWSNDPAQDTLGYTYEITNVTGTATGIMLAGEPIHLGQGCDFAVGTIYGIGDPTGTWPLGTGYGSTDSFGLMNAGAYAGCFFFGGWPANPWSSYYMEIVSADPGCAVPACLIVCDGRGVAGGGIPCPCGNENDDVRDEGCLHSFGSGGTLVVTDESVANFSATATHAPGNGGIFLTGTATSAPGTAAFDGIVCTSGATLRLQAGFETAPGIRVTTGGALTAEANSISPGYAVPGGFVYMTYWFRDIPPGGPSPCGTSANFTVTIVVPFS